jgi:hypothetical protein
MSTYTVHDRAQKGPGTIDLSGISRGTKKAAEEVAAWLLADDPAQDLVSHAQMLITKQEGRLQRNIRYLSLYANRDFMTDFAVGVHRGKPLPRMSDNQLKKHCDTTVGKVIQANSRVTMLTHNGDFALWQRARKMEQALKGEWARMRFYREAQKACVDGFVTGTGIVKLQVGEDGDRIECDRVFPNEIFVDEMDAAFGRPTKMYQVRYVQKDTLAAMFPEKWDIIQGAATAIAPSYPWCLYEPGMILVVEAYALPVGDRPGRHVIALSSGTLQDEEWEEDIFPYVVFKPSDAPFGWYGQGWVEHTMGAQILLNKTLNIMEQGARLGIAPFWVVQEAAGLNFRHLDNIPGHIVETNGPEPKWVTNAPFHQAAPVYCQMLRQIIADFWGNNSMDTGGDVPINRIDSKKALREYQDLGASRITSVLERWTQDFFLDAAERTFTLAKRIAKEKGAYPVLVQDTYKKAVQLDWKDLDLQKDAYLLTPAPANLLSNTPAGKTDDIKELMDAGLITQKQGQRMMQGPDDINAVLSESSATEDHLDWVIEQIIEKGHYISPTSVQDLSRGLVRISDASLQYETLGLEQSKLDMFAQWLEEAQDIMQQMMAQHSPAGAPPALPGAPADGAIAGGIPGGPQINPATGPIPVNAGGLPALGAAPAGPGPGLPAGGP